MRGGEDEADGWWQAGMRHETLVGNLWLRRAQEEHGEGRVDCGGKNCSKEPTPVHSVMKQHLKRATFPPTLDCSLSTPLSVFQRQNTCPRPSPRRTRKATVFLVQGHAPFASLKTAKYLLLHNLSLLLILCLSNVAVPIWYSQRRKREDISHTEHNQLSICRTFFSQTERK